MMDVRGKRVLAIGAHPDDVEIMCAGTVLCLRDLGCEIHVVSLTLGDCGSREHGPEQMRAIRRREAEAACARIGASYQTGGFDDFSIFVDDTANRRVAAILRETDPFLVFTHPPHDYLLDHEHTSVLVRNACFTAPAPNYDTSRYGHWPATTRIPYLYYANPVGGVDVSGHPVRPQFYVDVSATFQQKIDMLACHESQRAWLRAHHGIDEYLDVVQRWSEELGRRASAIGTRPVDHAEAYQQHRSHPYPDDNILAALFGERVIPE
jgi:LmbE family N-acetylglucosaminyl deacetylase